VTQPPINVRVMSGTAPGVATEGKKIANAIVTLTDTGCHTKRESKTNVNGGLSHPGAPFGEYSLCVTGGKEGGNNGATTGLAKDKEYTASFENNTSTGPSAIELNKLGTVVEEPITKIKYAVIYMEGAGNPGELKAGESCP
jgi:hypothetical protein